MALIAIVDGDSNTRTKTAEQLRRVGHEVREFDDAESLIELIENKGTELKTLEPELIITASELSSPKPSSPTDRSTQLSGVDLIRRLRRQFEDGLLPILLENKDLGEELILQGIEAGASDVLVRPYSTPRLLAKIHMLLQKREEALKREQREALEETVTVAPPSPEERRERDQEPPRRSFGRFTLLDELGRGGMGIVYRAKDKHSGQILALKVLHTRAVKDRKFLARFLREIRILKTLESDSIVAVLDSGIEDQNYYLAMELIVGESCKQRLESEGPLPMKVVLDVAIGVSSALAALHQNQLVHRDVKPANILLANDGLVKLVDFGLAKQHGDRALTMTGEALGTPYYLSPEAIRGQQADIRADIYALGVTLFEISTHRKAFQGTTALEVFHNIFHGPTPDLSELRPEFPKALCEAIKHMMAREPKDRPQDPGELAQRCLSIKKSLRKPRRTTTKRVAPPTAEDDL